MTKLYLETKAILGADLGPENPLPPMGTLGEVQSVPAEPDIPDEVRRNIGYGLRSSPLPYTMQDGYGRDKHEKTIKTIVMENEFLKATFLPEYGGRLWSLVDKSRGRDLVYENPVLQPANLAIRNAWLSGGVEWNIGLRGHSPFTCSPVFAASFVGEDRTPVLRMYEFERIRSVPFQIDVRLPDDSSLLYVYVRIRNIHDEEVPMYWWSNIAYPEHPSTRVVVPADRAYRFGYGSSGLGLRDVPVIEGKDVTYTTNVGHSADYFFDIPDGTRRWIAAVDSEGKGLFQTSTDRLLGRKLFLWGSGPGGAAWQEFLSVPGKPYIEIQAGLAHTQLEHIPMPGGEKWSWLEAYGCVEADGTIVHGDDWPAAYQEVGSRIDEILPRDRMDALFAVAEREADSPVDELLTTGSPWGRMEATYRAAKGLAPPTGPELEFGTPLEAGQRQWIQLLEEGTFPQPDVLDEPVGYEVQPKWRVLLEDYVRTKGRNWYALLHLGVMQFAAGQIDEAEAMWQRSAKVQPNPWAYRNVGRLALLRGNHEDAVAAYEQAFGILESCMPLTIEFGKALLAAGRAERWLAIYAGLPEEMQRHGRFLLLYAQGLVDAGRLDEALAVVESEPEVTDLREGENSLTDVWYRIHERRLLNAGHLPDGSALPPDVRNYVIDHFPPPAKIDFRMRTKEQVD